MWIRSAPKSVPHVIREYGNILINTGLLCMATVLYRSQRLKIKRPKLRGLRILQGVSTDLSACDSDVSTFC